jgi:type IV secretory pathway VirB6-like protein
MVAVNAVIPNVIIITNLLFASSCRTNIAVDEARNVIKNATQSEPCKKANEAQANPTIKTTSHLL